MLTSKWATTRKSHISRWKMISQAWHAVTNPHLCMRTCSLDLGIVNISMTMLWVRSKLFRLYRPNYKYDFHLDASWPIKVNFRWYVSGLSFMVGGSSDSCHFASSWKIRQSKLPCHTACDRRFPLGYTCLLVYQNRKKESHLGNPGVGNGQLIEFPIYPDLFHIIILLCFMFLMLVGCVNHSGNRQNLSKTKWLPLCWNPGFRTFRCSTRTLTRL